MIPNKVLIVSKPRFGSTVFCEEMGNLTQSPYYSEPTLSNVEHLKIISKTQNFGIKIIAADLKQWEATKEILFGFDWDLIILLRRNEQDAKLSLSHIDYIDNSFPSDNMKVSWTTGYKQNPNIKIPKWTDGTYNSGERIYQEILGMNKNTIELTYENLYNEDRSIREQELNKVVDMDKIPWLIKKNVLDKLDPSNKYTNLPPLIVKKSLI
jgi:hypothetical protein